MVENGGNVVPISLGVDKASDPYHQCQHEGIFNQILSFLLPHFFSPIYRSPILKTISIYLYFTIFLYVSHYYTLPT